MVDLNSIYTGNINVKLIYNLIFICILSIIMIKDICSLFIPNYLTIALIILGIAHNYTVNNSFESSILGMGYYSLLFSLIYGYISDFMKKDVLGYGDIKLTMGIGSYLRYRNLWEGYLFFMLCFLLGSIYALYIIILKKDKKKEIPFAPFIVLAAFVMLFFKYYKSIC